MSLVNGKSWQGGRDLKQSMLVIYFISMATCTFFERLNLSCQKVTFQSAAAEFACMCRAVGHRSILSLTLSVAVSGKVKFLKLHRTTGAQDER